MKIFSDDPFIPEPSTPLYQQLFTHLQTAILAGRLLGGQKLPSTRALADELQISLNTVLNTYDQLMAEGYLKSVEDSGTFVADVLPEELLTTAQESTPVPPLARQTTSPRPALSQRAQAQMTSPQVRPPLSHIVNGRLRPFSLGLSALDAFPFPLWSRLVARHARQMSIGSLIYQEPAGYRPLLEAIATHFKLH